MEVLPFLCQNRETLPPNSFELVRNECITSAPKIFPGSFGSNCFQRSDVRIQNALIPTTRDVQNTMMISLGGKDFLSGTLAASSTLTLGTSRASSTLAISNCFVRVSNTASSTFVRRYRSAHVTPRIGNFRME